MAKLYKCVVCGEVVKRYNDGAGKFFNHCSTRQEVTDDNWINKPKAQSPQTPQEAPKPKEVAQIEDKQEASKEAVALPVQSLPTQKEAPEKQETEPQSLEIEEAKTDEPKASKEEFEALPYECPDCKCRFDALDNGRCPNPACRVELNEPNA